MLVGNENVTIDPFGEESAVRRRFRFGVGGLLVAPGPACAGDGVDKGASTVVGGGVVGEEGVADEAGLLFGN